MRHRATVERVQRGVAQGKPVPYRVVLAVNRDYVLFYFSHNTEYVRTSNRDEQFIVCWYQNLQPLWGLDNRSKGGKYTEEDKQSLICKYNEHKK